jgi:hypothetical protein
MTDAARSLLGSLLFVALIVLPVFAYLKRRGMANKKIVFSIFAVWLFWSAINTPIHEGAHALAGVLVGMHIRGARFVQHYWEGDFVNGYVLWDAASVQQFLFSTVGPYWVDMAIMLIAFVWFPRRRRTPFTGAVLLSVTYLRSIFDVTVNYTADTLFGGKGDFSFLLSGYPRIVIHGAALATVLFGAYLAAREIRLAHRLTKVLSAQAKVSVAG